MPSLARVRVHPIKALDPLELDSVAISPAGGLEGDRVYAVVDGEGEYVNGKRTAAVHRLDAEVDLGAATVTIGERGADDRRTFHLDRDRDALAGWLAAYLGYPVDVVSGDGGELTDSAALGGEAPGATVVSTATLEAVADWFPALDVDGIRRRFRANLEVDGVEAFWEDRLVGADARLVVGDVAFRDVEPVHRCVVPTRDPDTGEPTEGFRERFVRERGATIPEAARGAYDHAYALTVLARPTEAGRGETVAVGDPVAVRAPQTAGSAT